ncbi:MAG TPA: OmpA family protein [Cytophagaceae bacterium]|nr:OmpA family protein [Cytophagaceae bacterium]
MWSSKVIETNDYYRGQYYSTKEILGAPQAIPEPYKETYEGWIIGYGDSGIEREDTVYIVVGFVEPMLATQVVVYESLNPGAIMEVFAIDEKDKEISIYKADPDSLSQPYRQLSIPVSAKRKINAVKVVAVPSSVPGWNYINGIAISTEKDPVVIKPNLATDVHLVQKTKRMDDHINSVFNDEYPVVSADGNTLYITRGEDPRNIDGPKTDIWVSHYSTATNTWSSVENMGRPLNNAGYNFVSSIMPDVNTLLLGNQYNNDGSQGSGGISITHRKIEGWSLPENIIIKDLMYKDNYVSYFLVNNGKVLLISMEGSDSYGDTDIYVSFLQKDNTWSNPKNIGTDINTGEQESTPFLAPDGVTMYFGSKGYIGYGVTDIYMSRRLDDSWLRWSEPQNLGPDVNTNAGDLGFTISADGKKAFTYSYTNEKTLSDIYSIELSPSLKPEPVVLIKGKVFNAKTGKPIEARILYEDLNTGNNIGIARSEGKAGSYKIVLPRGLHYGFYAEAKGFLSVNESLDIPDPKSDYIEIEKDLYLVPIEVGQTMRINNVFFQRSTATLIETSYPELDRLVQILNDNPSMEIELSGHTDNVGDPKKNMDLSFQRVEVVKKYLIEKGIKSNRVTLKAYGGTKPVASNATEETRMLNRRVEFTITKH